MARDEDPRRQQMRDRRRQQIDRRRELLATPQADPVREYCRLRRYSNHVILGGLAGLVERWEHYVARLAGEDRRSSYSIEEYLHKLEARNRLAEVFTIAPDEQQDAVRERIAVTDNRFRELTFESEECIWGEWFAAKWRYTREQHWWHYRWPRQVGERWQGFPISIKPADNPES